MTKQLRIKNIDWIFLLCILLILQGSIVLKIIGVLLIVFTRYNNSFCVSGFAKFYIFILLFHLSYGFINLWFLGVDYLAPFIMVSFFWLMSLVIYSQIFFFFNKTNFREQLKTINVIFVICVIVVFIQYIYTCISLGTFNPYGISQAAGDKMRSIFANSSVSMLVMSFFFLTYFQIKKWKYCLLSFICLIMATYMSGTVLFLIASIVSLLLFSKIKLSYKIYFLAIVLIFISLTAVISPGNIKYAMGYINRIWENDIDTLPYKIRSFYETLDYWTSSAKSFLFGTGGGNFSSRVAFIFSGDYVTWVPERLQYTSETFADNHLKIWNYDFNNFWDNKNNTANQPFSFYNKIIGEYGFLGLTGFILFYLGFIIKNWYRLTIARYMTVVLLAYFILDYWYEYFTVMIIFEILVKLDMSLTQNRTKQHE